MWQWIQAAHPADGIDASRLDVVYATRYDVNTTICLAVFRRTGFRRTGEGTGMAAMDKKEQVMPKVGTRKAAVAAKSSVLLAPVADPIDLRDMVTFRLLRIGAKLTQGFISSYTSQFGIGLPEWRTLGMLGQFGPLPSIRIAELAEMDRGSISRAVAWLEQRDLVRRMDDPGHLRRKIVAMTAEGKRLHDRISLHAKQRQQKILASLTGDEQAVLNQLLAKLDLWAGELHAGAAEEARVPLAGTKPLPVPDKPVPSREMLLEQVAQLKRAIEIYA